MNLKTILPAFAFVALAACSGGGEAEKSADANPTACECVDYIKNQDEKMAAKCTEMRKDEAFNAEFAKCQAAAITGGDPDKVNLVTNEEIKLAMPADADYTVNAEASKVTWTGSKITGDKHTGNVGVKSGLLSFANGTLSMAKVVIDMNSLENTDLEADEDKQKLIGHLMSDDFFGVADHPEASFVFDSANMDGAKGEVMGQVTIKGITKPATAQVVVSASGDNKAIVSGTMIFDRAAHDVRYGSGTFFDNLGDKVINDDVIIRFKLEGVAPGA